MTKKRIRLTESQLHKIIKNVIRESVSPECELGYCDRDLIDDPTSHEEYSDIDDRFEDNWYDNADDERENQLAESKLARLVKNTVKKYITEAINEPGTLSNMATTMISDNAAVLRQFDSIGEVKRYIESEVNHLRKTSKEQKYRFLYGDGTRKYGGLMGAHSMNEILQILGHMSLGGNGLGLTKSGLARRRY